MSTSKKNLKTDMKKKTVKKAVKKKGKKIKQNKLEKIKIFFQKYFSYLLSGFIILSILLLLLYYFLSKSYFYNYIPENTEKFVHIELKAIERILENTEKKSLPFYNGIQSIMESSVDNDILSELIHLKIPYLTLIQEKNRASAFFIEKLSENTAKKFLTKFQSTEEEIIFHNKEKYKEVSLLSGKEIHCAYQKYLLYCSKEKEGVSSFTSKSFRDAKIIKQELKKTPSWSFIKWYINPESLSDPFLKIHKGFLSDVYGAIKINRNNELQVFIDIKTQEKNQKTEEKSKNSLSKYFSKDITLFYLSGKDFEKRWMTTENYYKEKSSEYSLILKGILQKKVSELFGNNVDFYADILPLFENEFAFSISKQKKENEKSEAQGITLNFMSQTKQFVKIEELLDAFFQNRGQFTVEKKELKIDEEILLSQVHSNESKVSELNERVGAARVLGYEIAEKPWGIFVAQKGNMVYTSSSQEGIKHMLEKKENSLAQNFPEKLSNPYEFGYLENTLFQTLFAYSPFQLPKFENFSEVQNISWETETYEEGMRVVIDLSL